MIEKRDILISRICVSNTKDLIYKIECSRI